MYSYVKFIHHGILDRKASSMYQLLQIKTAQQTQLTAKGKVEKRTVVSFLFATILTPKFSTKLQPNSFMSELQVEVLFLFSFHFFTT